MCFFHRSLCRPFFIWRDAQGDKTSAGDLRQTRRLTTSPAESVPAASADTKSVGIIYCGSAIADEARRATTEC